MTTRTAQPPAPPKPVHLTPGETRGTWTAVDGRFTITTYRAGRGATADEREQQAAGALDIVDTARRNILGHVGTDTARVYDREDAVGAITRVLRIEHRDAVRLAELRVARRVI